MYINECKNAWQVEFPDSKILEEIFVNAILFENKDGSNNEPNTNLPTASSSMQQPIISDDDVEDLTRNFNNQSNRRIRWNREPCASVFCSGGLYEYKNLSWEISFEIQNKNFFSLLKSEKTVPIKTNRHGSKLSFSIKNLKKKVLSKYRYIYLIYTQY
jgi:hypothetical protein